MDDQEKELLEGYRRLRPESQNLILSTVITAVMAEDAAIRENGLPPKIKASVSRKPPAKVAP
ncbi:MAG: hypothetical protein LBT16_03745 [Treponema sp.]|nr:hypothetical protein [Treponema sp.]